MPARVIEEYGTVIRKYPVMNCNSAYSKLHHMQSVKRWVALTIFILLIIGYLFSATFILMHIGHGHDTDELEGSCDVCAHLTAAENMLKRFHAAAVSALFALACFSIIRLGLKPAGFHSDSCAPVHMKVRLNN